MMEVTENERAIRDEIADTIKPGCRSRFGMPLPSFMPSSMLDVATTVATTEQELKVQNASRTVVVVIRAANNDKIRKKNKKWNKHIDLHIFTLFDSIGYIYNRVT